MAITVLRDEELFLVAGIHANLTEVVRPFRTDVVVVGVHLRPRLTAVLSAVHLTTDCGYGLSRRSSAGWRSGAGILVLNDRVQNLRIPQEDVETDPPDATRRQPTTELRPRLSAI